MMKKLLVSVLLILMVLSFAYSGGSGERSGTVGKLTMTDGTVYPSEPITIICGWAAGGNSDLMCQLLAAKIKEATGMNCNVTYLTGGDGVIALTEIASNTDADGYTLALCASGMFSVKPFIQDVPFDVDDFEFLPAACEEVYTIFVNKNTGFENLDDLVEYYKANPQETLRYGMAGSNGIPHLSTKMAFDAMGLENVQNVSYDGGASALAACLGGEVDAICVVSSIGIPTYESGDLNALVTLSDSRLANIPDVKTLGEYGYESISAGVQKAYVLPAGTNQEIVDYLSGILEGIYATEEWTQFLFDNTCNPCPLTGEEYKQTCIESGAIFWDLLEEQGLIKEGLEKPDYLC